jgi:hypothetical protein
MDLNQNKPPKLKKNKRSIDDKYEMIRFYESIESKEWVLEKKLGKNSLLIMLLI